MASYLSECVELLKALISALVDLLDNPWIMCCMFLVIIAAVVGMFKRLTS